MKDNFYIFDDLVPREDQITLLNYTQNTEIVWEQLENITGEYGGKLRTHKFPAKVHPQVNCKNEDIKNLIHKIELKITEKINLEFVKNYRWKINWLTPLDFEYDPMDLLHYDRINEHIAAVYYVNDAIGETYIYNNKLGNNAETYQENYKSVDLNSYDLLTKVTPKMGRCLVFDGHLAHHASYPSTGDRFVINFNFVAKEKNTFRNLL